MGNTLAPMQSEFARAAPGSSERDAKETLDRLEEMAQDRIDFFYDKICHDDQDRRLIPIDKVFNKFTYIGARVEEDDVLWVQRVNEAVNEFAFGPIAEGLSCFAVNTIIKLLNSNAGQRQIVEGYAISIDWLGGISRLDYYFFVYTFCSGELAKKKTSLIAACVVESSADIKDIDDNTLRVIVARAFRGGNVSRGVLSAIYTQLVMTMKQPDQTLSLTDDNKEALSSWYKSSNRKMVTNGDKTRLAPRTSSPRMSTLNLISTVQNCMEPIDNCFSPFPRVVTQQRWAHNFNSKILALPPEVIRISANDSLSTPTVTQGRINDPLTKMRIKLRKTLLSWRPFL